MPSSCQPHTSPPLLLICVGREGSEGHAQLGRALLVWGGKIGQAMLPLELPHSFDPAPVLGVGLLAGWRMHAAAPAAVRWVSGRGTGTHSATATARSMSIAKLGIVSFPL